MELNKDGMMQTNVVNVKWNALLECYMNIIYSF